MKSGSVGGLPVAAATVTGELIAQGAAAVVVVGSYARGEAHAFSDLDVVAVGSGDSWERLVDGVLVSVDWYTEDKARRFMGIPQLAGQHVPGWRAARIVHDPDRIAARIRQYAREWRWEDLGEVPDRTVAALVTTFGSNAQHLVGDVLAERWMAAAYTRSVLALQCAQIMVMHLRLLYGSEHNLWSAVAQVMGPEWVRAQRAAFGFSGEDLSATAAAALGLYRITAEETRHLLRDDQRAVVAVALRAIEQLPER